MSRVVIAALAVDPSEPTAKTEWAPSVVPAGMVTLTTAEPPTGTDAMEPASSVPPALSKW